MPRVFIGVRGRKSLVAYVHAVRADGNGEVDDGSSELAHYALALPACWADGEALDGGFLFYWFERLRMSQVQLVQAGIFRSIHI